MSNLEIGNFFLNDTFSLKRSVIQNARAKMESEIPDRIPWENQYYSHIIISDFPKSVKCKMCEKTFLDTRINIPYRIKHLNEKYYKTELTDHPERGFLQQKFVINTVESRAKCFYL